MAATLEWLAGHVLEQPPLEAIAARAGLSPCHFQRLFTRWVGLSPKKYLQALTLERARSRLEADASALETAYDVGLSGPGRLHDLFVRLEAVTPGEYRARGAGLAIRYGFPPTPFGPCLLMVTERGVCGLAFCGERDRERTLAALVRGWENARLLADEDAARAAAERVFAAREPVEVLVRGTTLQVKVWEALLAIPSGSLATYETVAGQVGRPRATRAVAGAVARNAVAYLIPCHRVIRKDGLLGGYRWGLAHKLALIAREAIERAA